MILAEQFIYFEKQSTLILMQDKYIQDLRDIKDMMSRSSKFISLSGLSGIMAGIYALVGAYCAHSVIYSGKDLTLFRKTMFDQNMILTLFGIAIIVLVLSIGTGILLTTQKAKKAGVKVWDAQSKRLVINLFIPLVTGGLLCLILISKEYIAIIAPLTLIFYGLALINASKYTLSEIRSLGFAEIALGLIDIYFDSNGLIMWSIGFGALHIIYGAIMYVKYDK